jgi:bifunctional DNA-binding transcriptional regulator/antitoxin component of YhaV-PrlF toxin-antitoxin module
VVPKPLRDRPGLTAGTEIEIEERGGAVEIRPRGRDRRAEATYRAIGVKSRYLN